MKTIISVVLMVLVISSLTFGKTEKMPQNCHKNML